MKIGLGTECQLVSVFECDSELHLTLEDWVLAGLKLGHPVPILSNLDLNKAPAYPSTGPV